MAGPGDDHRPLSVILPDEDPKLVCAVPEDLEVGLGQELRVQDTVGEDEPISLILPELDLVDDGRRQRRRTDGDHARVSVQSEKADDLLRGDAALQRLPHRVPCQMSHSQVREPVQHLAEQTEQCDLQVWVRVRVHPVVRLYHDVALLVHCAQWFVLSAGYVQRESRWVEPASSPLPLVDQSELPQMLQEHQ